MGLDCIILYNNLSKLPKEIACKFEHILSYGILNFEIERINDENDENDNNYSISFRGKAYSNIVKKITDKSLYNDLNSNELNEMFIKLLRIEQNIINKDNVQEKFESDDLNDWINLCDCDLVSPNEIIGLKEIFKTCFENNCSLYAWY